MNVKKRLTVAASMAVVALLGAALFGGVADAAKKKKKKGGATVTATSNVATVVGGSALGQRPNTRASVPLTISKKAGKGKVVAPSTVSITYSATGVADKLDDINLQLRAPNGRTVGIGNPAGEVDAAFGPYSETPNSSLTTCAATLVPPPTPCESPDATILAPYSSAPAGNVGLAWFSGVPVQGQWQLQATNPSDTAATISGVKLTIKTTAAPTTK